MCLEWDRAREMESMKTKDLVQYTKKKSMKPLNTLLPKLN